MSTIRKNADAPSRSSGLSTRTVPQTTLDLIKSYLTSLALRAERGAISRQTLVTYTQGIKTFARTVGIAEINTESYVKFLKSMDNISPSSVRTYKAAVLDFYKFCHFEYAVQIDWLALGEASKRYTKKPVKTLVEFDESAIDRLVDYALTLKSSLLDLRNRALIVTFVDTGFRNFEARELTIGDIDWETNSALIKGKGDKHAKVRFSPRAIQCIREYLAARADLDSAYPDRNALPLFARHDKSAGANIYSIGGGGVWAALKAVCREGGIDPNSVWTHLLRHKFVTNVYRATRNIKTAKELARHSNIETTDRYTHLVDSELDKVYDEIFPASH